MPVKHGVASQRCLQARHQQRGGYPLATDICKRDAQARGSERYEIIVVAAHGASGPANRCELKPRQLRERMWKELLLNLARDGEFVFQALALLLFLNKFRDRRRHFVERFAQSAKLVVLMNADAVAEVAAADSQRGIVQVANARVIVRVRTMPVTSAPISSTRKMSPASTRRFTSTGPTAPTEVDKRRLIAEGRRANEASTGAGDGSDPGS